MRRLTFFFTLFIIITGSLYGQRIEETWPKTLWCPNDTFIIKLKDVPFSSTLSASAKEEKNYGTDGKIGEYATIYYGRDSLRLNYHNKLPYAHIIYLNLESPKGKTRFRFHFNDITCFFPDEYMEKNNGNTQFDIPEVYELANIIWTLSPSGQRAKDLYKEGSYYDRVIRYFKPYMGHPIFKSLDFTDSLYGSKYYEFRENSFAFNFQSPDPSSGNTKLLFNGPYYYTFGDELADSSLFGKLKPLVEDFAKKSRFRTFYKSNTDYYRNEIQRQKKLLPVKQMWDWLEKQFPDRKYQTYKIVFSPLIGGSHSTQNYATPYKGKWFNEIVMFICGTGRYDSIQTLTEQQKEGLMSGVVFTEIDHNYVNPVTNKYAKLVDSIFSKRNIWAKKGPNSDFYTEPVSVFNEYMTHALFCLYVTDTYDKPTADYIIDNRERLMVERRNFILFKEFNKELIRLRQENKGLHVVDLYPLLLEWCRQQI